jgi:glycosyltransferase involved in cell wall biosynthesis
VAELGKHLHARGHHVQTLTSGRLPPKIIPYLISWLTIGLRALTTPRADRVIVMTDPPMLALWIPFLKLRHDKIIYWCQDLYPDLLPLIGIRLPRPVQNILIDLKRWALGAADCALVLGRCMAEKITAYKVKNVRIIPNWTEQDTNIANDLLSEKLTVLYAGNLGRAHPVEAIAKAVTASVDLPVQFTFMVSGQGEQFLREQIGAQSNVLFLPPQPWDKAQQIQHNAHLHLVALRPEATGLAVPVKYYATLRAGRPIIFIGAADSEIARHIDEHDCGTIITANTPEQLATALRNYQNKTHWQNHCAAALRAHQSVAHSLTAVAEIILAA